MSLCQCNDNIPKIHLKKKLLLVVKSNFAIALVQLNSLIFRPLYRMVVRFVLRKDSISLILANKKRGY